MKRYIQKAFAMLMCAFLVGTCMPLPVLAADGGGGAGASAGAASGAGAGAAAERAADPSVGEMGEFSEHGQAVTVVNVLPIASSITADFAASIDEIAGNAAFDLMVKPAGTAPFTYQWYRAQVDDEGTAGQRVELAGETGDTYRLSQHTDTLVDETTYIYSVVITDAQQQTEELSVCVTVSDGYWDRTLPDAETLPRVQGLSIHKDATLAVAPVDAGSPSYGFLQQAAEGMRLHDAWQLDLVGAPAGKDAFAGSLTVTLPLAADALKDIDAADIKVAALASDGTTALYDAVVDTTAGTVTCTVEALGAFAVAYPVPPQKSYLITATAGEGGSISPEGETAYAEGSSATYTVLPNPGYLVKEVLVDGAAVTLEGNTYTFKDIRAAHTIEATFELSEPVEPDRYFAVRAVVDGGNGLVGLNSGMPAEVVELSVLEGASATVDFVPDDGFVIASVTMQVGEGQPELVTVFGSSFLIAAVTADTVVTVSYTKGVTPPVPTHTVTATAGPGGSVSPAEQTVPHAGTATVSITPDDGFALQSVLVDGENRTDDVDANGVLTLHNVERDLLVQVAFVALPRTVTVEATAGPGGTITPAGSVVLPKGATQTFTFTPNAGKRVAFLTVGGSRFAFHGSSYTLFDQATDTSISVEFEDDPVDPENPPLIDVEAKVVVNTEGSEGGMVSPSGSLSVVYGGSQTFHIFPEQGYDLDKVLVNGHRVPVQPVASPTLLRARSQVGAAGGYRFAVENMTDSTNIDVHFKKLGEGDPVPPPVVVRSVTATASEGGMISPAGTTQVADGGSLSFTVKADDGWHLAALTLDGPEGETDVTTQVTAGVFELPAITADAQVNATFERDDPDPGPVDPVTYRITAQASAGGSINPSGTFEVREGTSVDFELTPDEGCKLVSLVVNGREVADSVQNGSYTLADVREGALVYATFRRIEAPVEGPFTIEAGVAGGHGTVSPKGTVEVAAGSDQVFYFYPDAGYTVDAVEVDGERLAWSPRSYTFADVRANHTLSVSFKPVAASVGGGERPGGVLAPNIITKTGDQLGLRISGLVVMAAGAAALAVAARRRMKKSSK